MKWVKFRIRTTTFAEDIIISALYDIGLEGAQIEDKVPLTALEKEQMFVDILPQETRDDGEAFLSFYAEENEDGSLEINGRQTDRESILSDIREQLDEVRQFCDIGEGSITVDETEDVDWVNNWKQYFHQFHIDDILVIPSWEEAEDGENALTLHIDPGTAFGTGMHETTQLCVRALRKTVRPGSEVLDVGTGSGILGILSLMFGAGHVIGTDLDPCSQDAAALNCEANGVTPDQFEFLLGDIITDPEIRDKVGRNRYDIAVANILAQVLVPLTPFVADCLKKGGIYITSGILKEKEADVRDAMESAGFKILEVNYQGDWVEITGQKEE